MAAEKVNKMCGGGNEKSQSLEVASQSKSGELAPMFVPGPYAIAHHLISSWVSQGASDSLDSLSRNSTSLSSL